MKGFELVFFRHGIASEFGITGDHDRPLTEDGIRKTRAAAEGLKKMEIEFDRIFTSPWLRATQTAAILSEVLEVGPPHELPELAGDRTVGELLDAMGALAPGQGRNALLVGHQPLLGGTVAQLLGAAGKCEIDLKKSGACAIQVDAIPPRKTATLHWLLTSKQLRASR